MAVQFKTVIFLKRNGFSLTSSAGVRTLTYPESVLKYEVIADEPQFTAMTAAFIEKYVGGGNKVLIIISDELVFKKEILQSADEKVEAAYREFLAEIPFEEGSLAKLKIYAQDRLLAVAAYAGTFKKLREIIEKGHGKVAAVLPAFAFGQDFNEAGLELTRVLKDCENAGVQKYNFLNEKEAVNAWPPMTPERASKPGTESRIRGAQIKVFAGLLLLVAFVPAVIFGILKYRSISTGRPVAAEPIPEITVMPEAGPPATTSATPVLSPRPPIPVTKAELKVRVLNGSGIPGQAGILKKRLEEQGFKNIETGNVAGEAGVKTLAEFGSRVGRPVINEVLSALSANLNGAITEATRSGEIDILITTR